MGIDWEFYLGAEGDDLADAYENNISDDYGDEYYGYEDETDAEEEIFVPAGYEPKYKQVLHIDKDTADYYSGYHMDDHTVFFYQDNAVSEFNITSRLNPTAGFIEALLRGETVEPDRNEFPFSKQYGYRVAPEPDNEGKLSLERLYLIDPEYRTARVYDRFTVMKPFCGDELAYRLTGKYGENADVDFINEIVLNAEYYEFPAYYENYVFTPGEIAALIDGKLVSVNYIDNSGYQKTTSVSLYPVGLNYDIEADVPKDTLRGLKWVVYMQLIQLPDVAPMPWEQTDEIPF